MIPYGRQSIGEDEISAVAEVLRGNWLTCGPKVSEFEAALAEYCGVKHAVAVANGTAALHVAMLAAEVGRGDRVLTSTNTFLSSANCAEFVGAVADFADIDSRTRCISGETIMSAWQDDVKAVVPVDFAGYPSIDAHTADWIHDRGAVIIEDASHALGASVAGVKVGGLPWVDMTTFSFHPVKTIATGEGGAILTNSDHLAERCRLARNHGMQRSTVLSEAHGPWYYEMTELGYNYRISDIHCALGI
ncbi:MAG: DegT/DnrJ/EryC1/StrS family aminotransferase, partial [Kiritimatiellae bacterium]|nr:DegT/DnrJ/EryC1/StrS family aminotransferase [Kiritimatiellia bacterium]